MQPMQTAELLGMKMCCWDFSFGGGGGGGLNFNKRAVRRVIAEKIKVCSCLCVGNNPYLQDVS
jgi:hypothetical protein